MRMRANPSRHVKVHTVDLNEALSAVSPKVKRAVLAAHEALQERGVRHILIGGLAVGAHGHPYATKDVDFLVGDEAFDVRPSGIVLFAPGIPIEVDGVVVDYLSPIPGAEMEELLDQSAKLEELSIIPIEQLVLMKLTANRPKDRAAIEGLLEAGIDADLVSAWLRDHAPTIATRFDRLVQDAKKR